MSKNKDFKSFLDSNKSVKYIEDSQFIKLINLWEDTSFDIIIKKGTNLNSFRDIILFKELIAIFHNNENQQKIEFIFSLLPETENYINRKTTYVYENHEYKTYFSEPSEALRILATGFREKDIPGDSYYRNLRIFRDYYHSDKAPDYIQEFFKDKIPISYYIEGSFEVDSSKLIKLCKHINFFNKYYHRKSPSIVIIEEEDNTEENKVPCLFINENKFPEIISIYREIDPIPLELFLAADANIHTRQRFLFYYQILEYYAYYFYRNVIKDDLQTVIYDVKVMGNIDELIKRIIEIANKINSKQDLQKMKELVSSACKIDDIMSELNLYTEYFSKDVTFEGGFCIDHSSIKKNIDSCDKNTIDSILSVIDKIRNALVHVREKREKDIILPTKSNDSKLKPYVFLIRRIAEKVVLMSQTHLI